MSDVIEEAVAMISAHARRSLALLADLEQQRAVNEQLREQAKHLAACMARNTAEPNPPRALDDGADA